ncbi:DNA-binding protein [Synechococcus sp. CS-1332]|uniref:type II toxin-antitoxin system RelB family antitoxin n=1 Tax=Synechococcus sp. CS-1332 TaxID=2847972 RepID=UPI00223B5050|nr:DNA-binding protein [Synechococcus sp. CS-1332]MCT0206859.1 ribbon-helix-helix protein, CopG family [Synechococcus sp. CS-1332]
MATSARLDPATEARLDRLASETGRTKAFYLRELIEQGLDDLDDAYLGAAAVERIRLGQERTYSLDEMVAELGLNASDL